MGTTDAVQGQGIAGRVIFVCVVVAVMLLVAGCSRSGVAASRGNHGSAPIAIAPTETNEPDSSPVTAESDLPPGYRELPIPRGSPCACSVATLAPEPQPAETATFTPYPTNTPLPSPSPTASPTETSTPSPTASRVPAVRSATATPATTPIARPSPAPQPTGAVTPRLIYGGSNTQRKWIALTLDVEASPAPLPSILDTLKEKNVRATFFILGQFAKANPDLIKRIVDDGHEIGNHSWSHPDFRTLKREQMIEELRKTEETVKEITGRSTKPYFRPPYSYRNQLSINVAGEEGYLTVVWTTETYDWKQGATAQTMIESVLKEARPGGIVVLHTSKARDAESLPGIIDGLRAEGYTLVTVSEVLTP